MSDGVLIALIYGAVKVITTARAEQNTARVLRELMRIRRDVKALKQHAGIEVDESGKVLVIQRAESVNVQHGVKV